MAEDSQVPLGCPLADADTDTDAEVSESRKTIDPHKEDVTPVINIKVLFFARARDLTGLSELCLEMADGSTARDCTSELFLMFPKLKEISNSMIVAVNEEYAPETMVLRNKDELAIIPPISGG